MKEYAYFFVKADGTMMASYPAGPASQLDSLLIKGWIPLREVVISTDSILLILQSPA